MKLKFYFFLLIGFFLFFVFCFFLGGGDSTNIVRNEILTKDASGIEENNKLVENNVLLEPKEESVNLEKVEIIIEKSKNLEQCYLELDEINQDLIYNKNNIYKYVSNDNYKSYKNDILYLVFNEVINLKNSISKLNEFITYNNSIYRNTMSIDSLENPSDHIFFSKYQEFSRILESYNRNAIDEWVKKNNDLISKSFRVDVAGSIYNYSFSELISIKMQKMPLDLKLWLSHNVMFNLESVSISIQNDTETSVIFNQIKNLNKEQDFFTHDDGINYSLEDIIFESGNLELIKSLLDGSISGSGSKGIVPIQNRLYNKILSDIDNISQHSDLLKYLKIKNIVPEFVFDENIGYYRLLGSDSIFLTESVGKLLEDIDINLRVGEEAEFSKMLVDESGSQVNQGLVLSTQKIQVLKEELAKKEIKCRELARVRARMSPKLKKLQLENFVSGDSFDDTNVLKSLYAISDSLSLEYIKRFQFIDSEIDFYENIDRDTLVPGQQSVVLNKLCARGEFDTFIDLLNEGWHLINYSRKCKKNYYSKFGYHYSISETRYPSLVYQSIDKYDYVGALRNLKENHRTNGFKYGPDSLSLLLDQVVPFGIRVDENFRTLIWELLVKSDISERHCTRLLLLKMKVPIYFNFLERNFDSIMACDLYTTKNFEKLEITDESMEKP